MIKRYPGKQRQPIHSAMEISYAELTQPDISLEAVDFAMLTARSISLWRNIKSFTVAPILQEDV